MEGKGREAEGMGKTEEGKREHIVLEGKEERIEEDLAWRVCDKPKGWEGKGREASGRAKWKENGWENRMGKRRPYQKEEGTEMDSGNEREELRRITTKQMGREYRKGRRGGQKNA